MGLGKGLDPAQGPGCLGIFVSAWQRHQDTDTPSTPISVFNSFFSHTYMIFFSKQNRATKVLMQMARPLPLPLLGFGGFPKLIEPRPIPLDKIPLWAVLDLRECVSHPSSQRGLRLLSGTPQLAMQPLKVATGVLSWEKAPTTEKHFLVILASTAQFHPGDQPTFALQLPSLQSGTDLRVRVLFQFLHHHFPAIFKQIHGTPFLGALEPQLTKLGLGVDTIDVLTRMKGARFIQEIVQLGLHLVKVVFFLGRIGLTRPFFYTLFLIIFQGSLHQLVHGTDRGGCRGCQWVCSGQGVQGQHEFTGEGLGGFPFYG